jgi:choline dehydrogenase
MHDYVIVGGGSAGCALAARLSEDPGTRVLLLEAGPRDRKLEIRVPAAFTKLFKGPLDWNYETEPQSELLGRRLYWPRGRVLGGCSSINAMMYLRGTPADFDWWAELGNPGWSWHDVLPYFRRMENDGAGGSEWTGGQGPVHVGTLPDTNPLTVAFLDAAQAFGLHRVERLNHGDQEGVGNTPVTQYRGRRWSAADAYLRPALRRPNLEVRTDAMATRVVTEGGRAVGVEFRRGDNVETAHAAREVILSCGAINSPQLLMLSGIGPGAHLRDRGVDVTVDRAQVGENLQDHLMVAVVVGTTSKLSLVAAESLRNTARWLLRHRGMLTSNVGEAAAFVRTHDDLQTPDVELIFAPVPFIDHGLVKPAGHGMTLGPVLLQPRSRGRVSLTSADANAKPRIEPRYLSDPDGQDLATMVAGVKLTRSIMARPELAVHGTAPIEPGPGVDTDAQLADFIREQAETLYHPVGTCRMGPDPDAVVDPRLRVRGVEALRVVDCSIMPSIVRGHTNAAAMMIAERAADLIREDARSGSPVAI